MGKLENTVEKHLSDEFVKLGGLTRKWVSPGHAGVPDQICITGNSDVYFVEVKTFDGTLSAQQRRELRKLRDLGQNACVVYGINGVDALIKSIKHHYAIPLSLR